jgi:PKD domain/RTX calcium-binding nonapeptide repeat (4 copies)
VPRLRLAALAAVACGLLVPAAASGTTYCVAKSSCVSAGGVDEGSNLQAALDAAAADSSGPRHRVEIGPGDFTAANGYFYFGADPVDIVGAGSSGVSVTRIAPPDVAANGSNEALFVASAGSKISDLAIRTAGGPGGTGTTCRGFQGQADLENVEISSGLGCNDVTGVFWDGALRHSHVAVPDDSGAIAARVNTGGPSIVEDSTLSGDIGFYDALGTGILRRVRIDAASYGISGVAVNAGVDVTADDVLIEVQGNGIGITGETFNQETTVIARGVTVSGGLIGAQTKSTTGHKVDMTIDSSIIDGAATSFDRCCFDGTANLTVKYSNFTAPETDSGGVGTYDPSTGNTAFFDPGYLDPNEHTLSRTSPLVDKGDPAAIALDESTTDLAGNPRVRDGDGTGGARRDVGAFEYQPQRPKAVATAKPSSAAAGTGVAFDGSKSTDADEGEPLTYAWTFDDGAKAVGAKVSHTFVFPGPHRGVLKVTDSIGLSATATAKINVLVRAPTSGDDVIYGTTGKDTLNGLAGNDRLFGLGASDTLNGGKGKDKLDGGPGKNTYKGGKGNDKVSAVNGKKDQVDCGGGKSDSVTADPVDVVKPNCEKVVRKP